LIALANVLSIRDRRHERLRFDLRGADSIDVEVDVDVEVDLRRGANRHLG
jgi:hypothetical protein